MTIPSHQQTDHVPHKEARAVVCGKIGRHSAGENPQKREQILAGAWDVFKSKGFDAASMNDITKAACVSKATLYVYFENKEELFCALVRSRKNMTVLQIGATLEKDGNVDEILYSFGIATVQHMISDEVVRAMRMILGVIEKIPSASEHFRKNGITGPIGALEPYLQKQVDAGTLKIENIPLAAQQFRSLCTGEFRQRALFGDQTIPVPKEIAEETVKSAVAMFMKFYGTS